MEGFSLTYPLQGWINHADSMGIEVRVQAGGIMRITAGAVACQKWKRKQ